MDSAISKLSVSGHARCALCGGTGVHYAKAKDVEYFTTAESFDLLNCQSCDVLYVDPMPTDRLSEIYPSNYYAFREDNGASMVRKIKEWLDLRSFRHLLSSISGDELSVLDIGGGTGFVSDLLKKADLRVTHTQIVDLDQGAEAKALEKGHAFFCGPVETFQSDRRYDVILMLNLIEHVAKPDELLRRAAMLLSEGGRLIVQTPNWRSLDARIFRHHSWGGYHCPRHFVLFTKESITREFRKADLTVESFKYTQGAPFWSFSVLAWANKLGLLRINAERPAIYHPLAPVLMAAFAAFDFLRAPFGPLSQMIIVAKPANTTTSS